MRFLCFLVTVEGGICKRVKQVDLITLQSCVFKRRDSGVTYQNLCSLVCANRDAVLK